MSDWREHATTDLSTEFEGAVARETIERYLGDAVAHLEAVSSVHKFVPIFAVRIARERAQALAQAEGLVPKSKPEVLFVCVHNAGRSQMAAVLTHTLSGGRVNVRSAGSAPAAEVNSAVAAAMEELGMDLSQAFPKPLTDEAVRAADVVITMGCGDTCPIYPGKSYEDWEVADPACQPLEVVREIRADVRERVLQLLDRLNVPARGES
ncbi:MAG: arsenate reductase ArsC [Chloroflexi bacterium]|nr:arsenate reductase ArsC [Chloroflexota bacterium]